MIALQQNTKGWLDFRKDKIGSSDAPIIMEKSPWKTPHQLWEEKVGIKEESFETRTMQRGKDLEPLERKKFEEKSGLVVWPDVLIHTEYDFIIASLDGITMNGKVAVEIKCPGAKTHQMALEGKISEHYKIQMQHQLAVTGLNSMFYFSFDGEDGVILKIERDNQLIERIIEKEKKFYRLLKENISPQQERSDIHWKEIAEKWKIIQEKKKKVEIEEKKCRNALIALSDQKTTIGCGVRVTQYQKKGRINYSKIPELKEMNLENYRELTLDAWRVTTTS